VACLRLVATAEYQYSPLAARVEERSFCSTVFRGVQFSGTNLTLRAPR